MKNVRDFYLTKELEKEVMEKAEKQDAMKDMMLEAECDYNAEYGL